MSTIKPGDVMLTKSCRMVRVLASRDDGAVAMRDYRSRVAVRSVDTDRLSYHSEHELTLVQPPATPQEPDEIADFWREVERSYEIEPRAFFEREAKPMGYSSAVAMAVHHMWKRDVKDRGGRTITGRAQGAPQESSERPLGLELVDVDALRAALEEAHALLRLFQTCYPAAIASLPNNGMERFAAALTPQAEP